MSASSLASERDAAEAQKATRCGNTGSERSNPSMSQSISDSAPAEQESIDRTDLASDAGRIGVDGDGATHYYSRIHSTVWVVADDGEDLEHLERDVHAGSDLTAWVDYVSVERGWSSTNLHGSFPEAFVAQLEGE